MSFEKNPRKGCHEIVVEIFCDTNKCQKHTNKTDYCVRCVIFGVSKM